MTTKIPNQIVTVDYMMDPQEEDIIFSGDELKRGMIVLIEDYTLRDYDGLKELSELSPRERREVRTSCYWCKIEKIVWEGGMVRFIALYADGSKVVRRYMQSHAWFVKKSSM